MPRRWPGRPPRARSARSSSPRTPGRSCASAATTGWSRRAGSPARCATTQPPIATSAVAWDEAFAIVAAQLRVLPAPACRGVLHLGPHQQRGGLPLPAVRARVRHQQPAGLLQPLPRGDQHRPAGVDRRRQGHGAARRLRPHRPDPQLRPQPRHQPSAHARDAARRGAARRAAAGVQSAARARSRALPLAAGSAGDAGRRQHRARDPLFPVAHRQRHAGAAGPDEAAARARRGARAGRAAGDRPRVRRPCTPPASRGCWHSCARSPGASSARPPASTPHSSTSRRGSTRRRRPRSSPTAWASPSTRTARRTCSSSRTCCCCAATSVARAPASARCAGTATCRATAPSASTNVRRRNCSTGCRRCSASSRRARTAAPSSSASSASATARCACWCRSAAISRSQRRTRRRRTRRCRASRCWSACTPSSTAATCCTVAKR